MATVKKRFYEEVEACERCKMKFCEYTVGINVEPCQDCIDPLPKFSQRERWCRSCTAMIVRRYSHPIKRTTKAAKAEAVEADAD